MKLRLGRGLPSKVKRGKGINIRETITLWTEGNRSYITDKPVGGRIG